MFYACPSCKEGAVQDWRPESVIIVAGACARCGEVSDNHRGCSHCKRPHCLPCVLKHAEHLAKGGTNPVPEGP